MRRSLQIGFAVLGLGLMSVPMASAQIMYPQPAPYPDRYNPYWRQQREHNWRAEAEFRREEERKEEWRRDHCVRDFYNHVLCR